MHDCRSPLATKGNKKSTMSHISQSCKQMLDQCQDPAGNKTKGTVQDKTSFLCLEKIEILCFFASKV